MVLGMRFQGRSGNRTAVSLKDFTQSRCTCSSATSIIVIATVRHLLTSTVFSLSCANFCAAHEDNYIIFIVLACVGVAGVLCLIFISPVNRKVSGKLCAWFFSAAEQFLDIVKEVCEVCSFQLVDTVKCLVLHVPLHQTQAGFCPIQGYFIYDAT